MANSCPTPYCIPSRGITPFDSADDLLGHDAYAIGSTLRQGKSRTNGREQYEWVHVERPDGWGRLGGAVFILLGAGLSAFALVAAPTNGQAAVACVVGGGFALFGLIGLAASGEVKSTHRAYIDNYTTDRTVDDRHNYGNAPASWGGYSPCGVRQEPLPDATRGDPATLTRNSTPEQAGYIPVQRGGNWLQDLVGRDHEESER